MNKTVYNFFLDKKHHEYRHAVDWNLAEEYSAKGMTPSSVWLTALSVFARKKRQ